MADPPNLGRPRGDPDTFAGGYHDLTPAALLRVEAACAGFERECRAGRRPDHAPYLDRADPADRAVLGAELAALAAVYAPPAPAPRPDRTVGDHFALVRELGRGGMGVVYLARDRRLDRLVALKVLRDGDHAGPAHARRLLAEARAVARLRHPNIVQIYEVGEADGRPYLALEFVEGMTLAAWAAGRVVPPAEAVAVLEPIARAVHYAHQCGVIHRDLKPANVMLAVDPNGAAVVPKVTDFGLAKHPHDGADLTPTGAALGTPAYMAPEQLGGGPDPVGPAADVYALGATLYEVLTGRPPFRGATPLAVAALAAAVAPVRPRAVRPDIPPGLEAICLKCLEKRPGRRYADAAALADDLHRFAAGLPTRARPPARLARVWRWVGAAVLLAAAVAPGPQSSPTAPPPAGARAPAAGGPVELLDDTAAPPWHTWGGLAAALIPAPNEARATSFQTQQHSLLKLTPDPGRDRFRLTADLRHLQSGGAVGWVGVGIGWQEGAAGNSRWQRFLAVRFSDFPAGAAPRWLVCDCVLLVYGPDGRPNVYTESVFEAPYAEVAGRPWKQIELRVGPAGGEARLSAADAPLAAGTWTAKQLADAVAVQNRRLLRKHPDVHPAAAFEARGPLGVCAANAAVSMRRVRLDPAAE